MTEPLPPEHPPLAVRLAALRQTISHAKTKEPKTLDQPLTLQHGWMIPYLLLTDEFLWRRWCHWFETMTAQKVIAAIPRIEWSKNQAGFKLIDRCLGCISKYGEWRGWGNWSAFDYFLDWLLFGLGHKGQPKLPTEPEEYKGASERLYQVFNLETLLAYPHDYFGDILAENRHGRHLGFYPTPMEICELMSAMTIGEEDARTKSVMDPCVGTGRMLLSASNHSYRLYGCDINPTVIKVTLVNGFLYAPWLVRPFPFLDPVLANTTESQAVSDSMARQAPAQLEGTEHDIANQWKFEPIKKRRRPEDPLEEQGLLLTP